MNQVFLSSLLWFRFYTWETMVKVLTKLFDPLVFIRAPGVAIPLIPLWSAWSHEPFQVQQRLLHQPHNKEKISVWWIALNSSWDVSFSLLVLCTLTFFPQKSPEMPPTLGDFYGSSSSLRWLVSASSNLCTLCTRYIIISGAATPNSICSSINAHWEKVFLRSTSQAHS